MKDDKKFIKTLKKIIKCIEKKDHVSINKYCKGGYMRPEYVIKEVEEFPGRMTFPPKHAFADYPKMDIDQSNVIVWFNLWFDNQESDLILEIKISYFRKKITEVTIQNLRVM